MKYPKNKTVWKGQEICFTWIKTNNFSKYSPITQAYAVIFNEKKEVLIGRKNNEAWSLPGGTPEDKESLKETLVREVLEEVDVKISNITKLGIQKVEFEKESETIYQSRYVTKLKKILPQTVDPDSNTIWERKLLSIQEALEHLNWGNTGKAILHDASELFIQTR